jgi:serine protease
MNTIVSRFVLAVCGFVLSQHIQAYDVTSGQSGAWFDQTHNGEGYFLQVLSDTQAAVFWFSYDKNGEQFWMIGIGNIEGSKITFPGMISPNGGKFGPNFDPEDVEYPVWGSLEFDFSSCSEGTATYSGPAEFGSGTLNLTRLTSLWGLDCQGNYSNPASTGSGFLNTGFSGSWFDFSHDGEGFVVEVLSETAAVVIWFTYDTEGNPAWMLGSGVIDGATILVNEFQITRGGIFGPEFNPVDVIYDPWGPAAFTFGSCDSELSDGIMRYIPPDDFGIESSQFLNRLIEINGLGCGFLSNTYDVNGVLSVAENIFLDGDVNDPGVEEVSNDPEEENVQQLVPPAKVAGFATNEPTGVEGDRFAEEADEWDAYVLAVRQGESISLNISDWDANDKAAIDFDLYLFDINDPENVVDSSLSIEQTEWVTAPADGNYFVLVHAYSGTSNYLLRSGQSAPAGASALSVSAKMKSGELIASLDSPPQSIESSIEKQAFGSRVERAEKDNALHRLAESGPDVLYSVDMNRTDLLVPHPLTAMGKASISAEDWRTIRAAKTLSANPAYRWAGPNYIHEQMATPNDTYYNYQWHYPQIKLPQAWDITTGSTQVVVAVIDSGVADHPDLTNVDFSLGVDMISDTLESGDGDGVDLDARDPGKLYPTYQDYQSHGTHVAGTVGATGNNNQGLSGVNWSVTIMPVRALGVNGSGSCWGITEGMKWAGRINNETGQLPSRQADIINMSLGGSPACPGSQDIVNQLVAKGIVVIAAAGNESTSSPSYPAALDNVISVSSTGFTDELAPYSNFGSTVDVAAPGGDSSADQNNDGYIDGVLSTVLSVEKGTSNTSFEYVFMQGTSMASPHMAGVAALMKSVYPSMGPNEFLSALSSGSITVDLAQNGATNKDSSFGYGRIDAQKAVNWALGQEQGQTTDAFLTTSVSSVNFGPNLSSVDFQVGKGGSGALSITGGGTTDDWIELWSVSTDGDGLGTYRIIVDRTGLIDGSYSGWAGLNSSDGKQSLISVSMRVGDKAQGEAGHLYALLLDSWTLGNVKQWDGLAAGGEFFINLPANPPGTYYLMVGSDIDHDFTVCDPGDLCQIYPLNSQPGEIVITDNNVQLGRFSLRFPDDTDAVGASSKALGLEPAASNPEIEAIRARIGNKGVALRR